MTLRQDIGKAGEDAAVEYLESKGYVILDRNYRFMRGELDIVALDDPFIVFVEVKTRRRADATDPHDSVGPEKQRHINALRRVLQKCAALSPEISDLKHEVLLETAPENH